MSWCSSLNIDLPAASNSDDRNHSDSDSPTSSEYLPECPISPELHGVGHGMLSPNGVHPLIILDFDDCIFPTSFRPDWFWEGFKKMDQTEKEMAILNVRSLLVNYDDYLANALRKLLDDGCTVEIATSANQSWIDLAMDFLPKTSRLLTQHHAYPQVEDDPLPIPVGTENKKIIKHKDIVEKFMRRFRDTNLGRGLIMAVGDHNYDVAPLQTFMRHKDEWLAPMSRREIDGYTIKMRTNAHMYPTAGDDVKQKLMTHQIEMRSVLSTMTVIFNMHNNKALWLAHAQKLREATEDAETALNKALKECDERRHNRIQHCIPWTKEILNGKLKDKELDKKSMKLLEAIAQEESSKEGCRELRLKYQGTKKGYTQHARHVMHDWHTAPYKGAFVTVPHKKLVFPEICRKVAELDEGWTRPLFVH